jgi:acyl carrier protein
MAVTKTEFIDKLARELTLEPRNLTGDEALAGLGGWDSMAAIQFITLADTLFSKRIGADELERCRTVNDLVGLFGDQITA